MSSRRFALLIVGVTMALGSCESSNAPLNKPDPNMYTLRLVPESISMEVGSTTAVSLFASQTGGDDISIHSVEWTVDNQTIAAATDSSVSVSTPIYATTLVTCRTPGKTTLAGIIVVGFEQKVSQSMTVTCTAATH